MLKLIQIIYIWKLTTNSAISGFRFCKQENQKSNKIIIHFQNQNKIQNLIQFDSIINLIE